MKRNFYYSYLEKFKMKKTTTAILFLCIFIVFTFEVPVNAQQFNSDNYLTMPHGTGTFVLTAGQRNAAIINSFALVQDWEFFAQANLYWENQDKNLSQHFTTTLYI